MNKYNESEVRKAFINALAISDETMGEVFDTFSYDPPSQKTQVDHKFDGNLTSLIDQVLEVWRQIQPTISATADIGGIIAIISTIRDKRKDEELKGLLDEVIKRLDKTDDADE